MTHLIKQYSEEELRLAILQVPLAARRKRPKDGGAAGRELVNLLNLDSIDLLERALDFLRSNGLIECGERKFLISAIGVDYVMDHLPEPPNDPPEPPDPPWSPGDPRGPWPPSFDPDDPSRVPKRPKPSSGDTEMSLDLPDVADLQG